MKKNTIAALVSCATAFTLAATLAGCAPAPAPVTEPADETPQVGIKLNIEAEGWDADASTPVIATFTEAGFEEAYVCTGGEDEEFASAAEFKEHAQVLPEDERAAHSRYTIEYRDDDGNKVVPETFIHRIEANTDQVVELEAGPYALTLISPVNADGSIYTVPATAEVEAAEIADEADALELKLIPADEVTPEQVEAILAAVTVASGVDPDAVPEALIDQAKANAAAGPNITPEAAEEAEKEAEKVAEAASSAGGASVIQQIATPQGGSTGGSSLANTGSAGSGNAGGSNSGGSAPAPSTPSNSGSNNGGGTSTPAPAPSQPSQPAPAPAPEPEPPAHEHSWSPSSFKDTIICNTCGTAFGNQGDYIAHAKASRHAGYSVQTEITGYTCSCGATK